MPYYETEYTSDLAYTSVKDCLVHQPNPMPKQVYPSTEQQYTAAGLCYDFSYNNDSSFIHDYHQSREASYGSADHDCSPHTYANEVVTTSSNRQPYDTRDENVFDQPFDGMSSNPNHPQVYRTAMPDLVQPGLFNDSFSITNERQHPMYPKCSYKSETAAVSRSHEGILTSYSSESSTASMNRPLPAKSAFMCFSEAKRGEIMTKIGENAKNEIVKAVAKEWRDLSKSERKYWEDMARIEKTRHSREKKTYSTHHKGLLTRKLRAKKNPLAPKRPMSAFLMYAQKKRKELQAENPDMPNADISRLLGETWKSANIEEKAPYLEREEIERKIYRAKMDSWKNDQKLANSFKSPMERKRNFDCVDQIDQREDSDSFAQRYVPSIEDTFQNKNAPFSSTLAGNHHHTHNDAYDRNLTYNNATFSSYNEQEFLSGRYSYPRPRGDQY